MSNSHVCNVCDSLDYDDEDGPSPETMLRTAAPDLTDDEVDAVLGMLPTFILGGPCFTVSAHVSDLTGNLHVSLRSPLVTIDLDVSEPVDARLTIAGTVVARARGLTVREAGTLLAHDARAAICAPINSFIDREAQRNVDRISQDDDDDLTA